MIETLIEFGFKCEAKDEYVCTLEDYEGFYLFTDGLSNDGELTFDFYFEGEHLESFYLETKSLHKIQDIYYEAEILARDYE